MPQVKLAFTSLNLLSQRENDYENRLLTAAQKGRREPALDRHSTLCTLCLYLIFNEHAVLTQYLLQHVERGVNRGHAMRRASHAPCCLGSAGDIVDRTVTRHSDRAYPIGYSGDSQKGS